MGVDEEGTHERLKSHRCELVDPKIAEHHGRMIKTTGDGVLVEFPRVVDAVRCAVEVQGGMVERNSAIPPEERIEFRVGINLGDISAEGEDIFGDGVNIAARLEALAEPGGICISRVVRDQVRDRLDYTFEDLGEQRVKNIARPVRVYRVRTRALVIAQPPSLSRRPLPLPDKPSIAVLPFANLSGDPGQEYFADGMVEEIITALSRIRWLFVIARNSSFTYKGQAVDVKRVGRELGVRYVLGGSVRKSGGRVRITAQLVETESGAHLWADRFDGLLEEIFELQDQVAISVAGVIEPTLLAAEIRRSSQRPTDDLSAYDLTCALCLVSQPTNGPLLSMRWICFGRRLRAMPISPLPWPLPPTATRRSTASAGLPIGTPIDRRHSISLIGRSGWPATTLSLSPRRRMSWATSTRTFTQQSPPSTARLRSTRALPTDGGGAALPDFMPATPSLRSNTSSAQYASTPATCAGRNSPALALRTFSGVGSRLRTHRCSRLSTRTRLIRWPIGFSRRATRIWAGSTKRER